MGFADDVETALEEVVSGMSGWLQVHADISPIALPGGLLDLHLGDPCFSNCGQRVGSINEVLASPLLVSV
jgi:hypothetical protein|tara:strand:- start:440 stop:649 length:210 start_codon:yes stop_codon:yes gene_type:complete